MAPGPVALDIRLPQAVRGQGAPVEGGCRGLECTICYEAPRSPVVTFCGHLFCWGCLSEWAKLRARSKRCPVCQAPLLKVVRILGQGGATWPVASHLGDNADHESGHETPQSGAVLYEDSRQDSMSFVTEFPGHASVRDSPERNREPRHTNPAIGAVDQSRMDTGVAPDNFQRSADADANAHADFPRDQTTLPEREDGLANNGTLVRARRLSPGTASVQLPYRTQSHTAAFEVALGSPDQRPASASSSPAQGTSSGEARLRGRAGASTRAREQRVLRILGRWLHERSW